MKKLKPWLSIAALKLGLRKRTEADAKRWISQHFQQMKKKHDEEMKEWLSDDYKNGSEADKLLHEYATIKEEMQGNANLLKARRIDPEQKKALIARNRVIHSRMFEILTEYGEISK